MTEPSSKARKRRYRITNWHDYDRALIARGDVTVWIDKEVCWIEAPSGQRGRPKRYSDAALQCVLTLKALYRPACGTGNDA